MSDVVRIQQQWLEDPASGLIFEFTVTPGGEGRMRVKGDWLPLGNRVFAFDAEGTHVGSGSWVASSRPPHLSVLGGEPTG